MSSLRGRSLRDILTFTRASTATYCDAAGVLVTAEVDEPRIEYDPATLAARGRLIEGTRTNHLFWSHEFDQWTTSNIGSVSTDAINAPDGTLTADLIIEDATASTSHYVIQAYTKTSSTEVQAYAVSIWAKAKERTELCLSCQGTSGSANSATATFNVSAGTVGSVTVAGQYENGQARIEKWPNGWYRCMIEVIVNNDGQAAIQFVAFLSAGGTNIYSGDGTSGLYLWGAQLEKSNYATSYIATAATTVTRQRDVCSVASVQPWFNEPAGTIYAEYMVPWTYLTPRTDAHYVATADDGSGSNTHVLYIDEGTRYIYTVREGVAQVSASSGTHAAGVVQKHAMSWATDDVSYTANGSTVSTDTSATMPESLTTFRIGYAHTAGYELSGYIRRVRFWPRTMGDTELQALVT